jgi:hypothetical protein
MNFIALKMLLVDHAKYIGIVSVLIFASLFINERHI